MKPILRPRQVGLTIQNGLAADASTFEFALRVNLYGTFLVSSICAAAMALLPPELDGSRGCIINVIFLRSPLLLNNFSFPSILSCDLERIFSPLYSMLGCERCWN